MFFPPELECKINSKADSRTKEIAEDLVDLIKQKLGKMPHLIALKPHRSQIDANREINEACMGCSACEVAYNSYHSKVLVKYLRNTKGALGWY